MGEDSSISSPLATRLTVAVSAPAVWNNIPAAVRDTVSLDIFKTAFKTYLFNCAQAIYPIY